MMRGRSKDAEEYQRYIGIELGLIQANRKYISVNKDDMEFKRNIVELIIGCLINLMRSESPTFSFLYARTFGGGSANEELKITKPNEFDIDILLRIPKITAPILLENNIPGYVNLRLEKFERLKRKNPAVYTEMQDFIDEKNYLLTKKMKGSFMQSVFDRVMKQIPDNTILVGDYFYKILRVQNLGPAFTLTIHGPKGFKVSVDLVPCILLDKSHWPGEGFERNPYSTPSEFFIVPKSPKRDIKHIERYWRLSFQEQEREMLFDRQRLKPTLRVLKRIRDVLNHQISSYAIKNMFLKELKLDNPILDDETPELWSSPWSYCVVHMLKVYADYLEKGKMPYFWNKKMNLFEDLTPGQITQYKRDVEYMLQDIKDNPVPETIYNYLS